MDAETLEWQRRYQRLQSSHLSRRHRRSLDGQTGKVLT
jgi:hypothetical protein